MAWKKIGVKILENAWKGLNNTVFAYGQTGAGKSYTTFGYGKNPGFVPHAGEEMFKRIVETTNDTTTF